MNNESDKNNHNDKVVKKSDGKAKQVLNFFADGAKKAMSVDTDSIVVSKMVKKRTIETFTNFKDVLSIFLNSFLIIFYFVIGIFIDAKKILHAFFRAANNNFRLGLENLKSNNLVDARIRFLLSDMFYGKSSTTKYYIAYVYYMQGNYTKSLKYLKKSLAINSHNKRAIWLLNTIEKEFNKKSIDN